MDSKHALAGTKSKAQSMRYINTCRTCGNIEYSRIKKFHTQWIFKFNAFMARVYTLWYPPINICQRTYSGVDPNLRDRERAKVYIKIKVNKLFFWAPSVGLRWNLVGRARSSAKILSKLFYMHDSISKRAIHIL